MAKLIYAAIMSLDGYIEDKDGKFDWAVPDEEVHQFINDLERSAGTHPGAPYATIMVSLGSPGLYILPSGGVTILSSPQGDDMVLDGIPPVTIPMEQENHTGNMTNEGYISPTITLVVPGGDTITVERSSEPAGNHGTIHPVMTPPEKLPIPIPVITTALGCVPGLIWLRKKTEW